MEKSHFIITDSGGVTEEATVLDIPCMTIRDNTERPETVTVKANIVSGTNPQNIIKCVNKMLKSKQSWLNPFGNGNTSKVPSTEAGTELHPKVLLIKVAVIVVLPVAARSVEGIKVKNKPVFSVQYHPEASPGPQDSKYLFNEFISYISKEKKYAKKKRS